MQLIWIDYFLAAFFSSVALFYVSLILTKQKNTNDLQCVHIGPKYSMHWCNHMTFRVFRILIWAYCVFRLFTPSIDGFIMQFESLYTMPVRMLGLACMCVGFILAVVSNMTMQKSWRSGIDEKTSSLVTHGIYQLSRNPAYIGVAIAQIGFFLAVPNVFTAICMGVGLVALVIQTKLEEQFLFEQFGGEYAQYVRDVPRIL